MTREEWKEFERIRGASDIRLIMKARCEEQGHERENCASITFQIYMACKWCGLRQ